MWRRGKPKDVIEDSSSWEIAIEEWHEEIVADLRYRADTMYAPYFFNLADFIEGRTSPSDYGLTEAANEVEWRPISGDSLGMRWPVMWILCVYHLLYPLIDASETLSNGLEKRGLDLDRRLVFYAAILLGLLRKLRSRKFSEMSRHLQTESIEQALRVLNDIYTTDALQAAQMGVDSGNICSKLAEYGAERFAFLVDAHRRATDHSNPGLLQRFEGEKRMEDMYGSALKPGEKYRVTLGLASNEVMEAWNFSKVFEDDDLIADFKKQYTNT
jgi:hypothetical protein